ncbi:MAG: aminoacetone oxidase family FAD-binding enzyme [Rikenellaceae bacterium]
MYDLIVIGAGAAGLMAAGRAAEEGIKVLVLEKMEKPARKIRITGKGRCNLTNTSSNDEFISHTYSGEVDGEVSAHEFIAPALRNFNNHSTMRFFSKLELDLTVERGGRVFPTSGKAWDVANTLEYWAKDMGAVVECDSPAKAILKDEEGRTCGVELQSGGTIKCKTVLIATGGASYPRTGSSGDGYMLANELGHEIIPLTPALIPVEIDEDINDYRGLVLKNVNAKLLVDGQVTQERFGEAEFTDKALGGAIILKLSRYIVEAIIAEKRVEISFDLKTALKVKQLEFRLKRDIEELPEDAPLSALLDRLTPRALHHKIANNIGMKMRDYASKVDEQKIPLLIETLKDLRFNVTDYRPFEEAIVTSGGVKLSEVNPQTMGSTLVRGLYFAGEVLDIDAETGGYNIQLALSTGRLAGQSAATAVLRRQI